MGRAAKQTADCLPRPYRQKGLGLANCNASQAERRSLEAGLAERLAVERPAGLAAWLAVERPAGLAERAAERPAWLAERSAGLAERAAERPAWLAAWLQARGPTPPIRVTSDRVGHRPWEEETSRKCLQG